jgi:hypothetical protein
MLKLIFGWLTGSTLDRILSTVESRFNNKTEQDRIKSDVTEAYLKAQVATLTGPGWWFPLFFVVPLGLWFSSVCIYSIFFCAGCRFPQTWTIAALPPPLDEWSGGIVASMFIYQGGKAGVTAIAAAWGKK